MALDPKLLEILACPEDKGPLLYFEDESSLYNPRLKRRYAVRDDIPIMLIDEAETVDDAEHDRLVAKAEADGISPRSRRKSRAWPSIRSTSARRSAPCPSSSPPRTRPPGRSTATRCPRRRLRSHRHPRDGRLRHRRRHAPGRRHRDAADARSRC